MDPARTGWNESLTRKKELAGVKGVKKVIDVSGRKLADGFGIWRRMLNIDLYDFE